MMAWRWAVCRPPRPEVRLRVIKGQLKVSGWTDRIIGRVWQRWATIKEEINQSGGSGASGGGQLQPPPPLRTCCLTFMRLDFMWQSEEALRLWVTSGRTEGFSPDSPPFLEVSPPCVCVCVVRCLSVFTRTVDPRATASPLDSFDLAPADHTTCKISRGRTRASERAEETAVFAFAKITREGLQTPFINLLRTQPGGGGVVVYGDCEAMIRLLGDGDGEFAVIIKENPLAQKKYFFLCTIRLGLCAGEQLQVCRRTRG